jgi:hypothetical protein
VSDQARHPHMVRCPCTQRLTTTFTCSPLLQMAVKNCFIRGSVVRYVQLPAEHVDTQLLEDATRRGKPPFSSYRRRCNRSTRLIAALSPNRGRDSNQAVTSFVPQLYRFRHVFSSFRVSVPPICPKRLYCHNISSQPNTSIMC